LIGRLLDEGRRASDCPGTLADAQARIAEMVDLLEALPPHALDANPEGSIDHELPNGMIFELTAEQYARDWAAAQFYFHVMTAYAILRAGKVELGKADYIPHLLSNLRSSAKTEV
jgi:hypothetical protein